MAWIYCIENKLNNKKYIGETVRHFKERWRYHKYLLSKNNHTNPHLQNAWNKYGEDNFIFYTIEECNNNESNQKEIYWINILDTINNGYDITNGGKGTSGWKASEETKQKHREQMLNMSDETRNKLKEKAKGNKNSEGICFTKERKQRISNALLYKKKRNSSSKFFGVSFYKNTKKWLSYVTVNKKNIFLGWFNEEIEAAKTYNNYVKNNNLSNPLNPEL
jgi:group I intron endonuclease